MNEAEGSTSLLTFSFYCTFYVKGKYLSKVRPPGGWDIFWKNPKNREALFIALKSREELEKWAAENIDILGQDIYPSN